MQIGSTPFNRFEIMRQQISDMQRNITRAQTEATTGRLADPVSELGSQNADRISWSAASERLSVITDSNQVIIGRLSASQLGLDAVSDSLTSFSQTLTATIGGDASNTLLRNVSTSAVESLKTAINTQFGNTFVFGGTATNRPPIGDLSDAATTLETEFQNHFGFPTNDPQVAGITDDQMTTFLETVAEPALTGAAWATDFFDGVGDPIRARISPDETSTVSITADEFAMRQSLVSAFLAQELSQLELNDDAVRALASHSLSLAANGSVGIAELQGQISVVEEKLSVTNDRLLAHGSRLQQSADELVAVDPFQAATEFTTLVTQLETAYTLTGRLQQLSLMRFIA
ncbi:MAG: flagellar hook-associated family protein [Ahrensia sp.]|nr:flagellar hook-associated family protein [Ahrensia sp.]